MSNIIDQLRNDAEYYSGVGRNYLSNSDIKTLLHNPAAFGRSRPDNKNLALGRYFHQLLFEPAKAEVAHYVDVSTRSTKAYKEYCETNNIEFAMLLSEKLDAERWAAAMRGNIHLYEELYAHGNEFEVPAVGEIFGLPFKGKSDVVTPGEFLFDAKTTSDILKFKYSARDYGYDTQSFIYRELFGKRMKFFVIDKETLQIGIFTASDDFINRGRDKVQRAVEVYNRYFGPNATDDIVNHCIEMTLE